MRNIFQKTVEGYDDFVALDFGHLGAGRSQTGAHDVRPAEDELDGSSVHLHGWCHEWICKFIIIIAITIIDINSLKECRVLNCITLGTS